MHIYLVLGATGRQGGATAQALLERGATVRCLVRQPEQPGAKALADQGGELIRGDFTDSDSLRTAMQGVHGVFLAQPLQDPKLEVEQAQRIIELTRHSGISQLVYSSALDAYQATGVAHFDSKHRVKEALEATDLNYHIIGPGGFMENLLFKDTWQGIEQGKLVTPFDLDVPQALISVADIGAFAASLMLDPPPSSGQFLPAWGDCLSAREQALVLANALGQHVVAERLPDSLTRQFMGDELAGMFDYFNQRTPAPLAEPTLFRQRVPARMDLQSWLEGKRA
jgi:uncharacterized protein YbjT (DUF2867 family)